MDDADRQYFEAMERLFTSSDWRIFARDIEGWIEAIGSQWASLRPDQLQFEQGRNDAMRQILTYPKLLEDLREKAEAVEEPTDEEAAYTE